MSIMDIKIRMAETSRMIKEAEAEGKQDIAIQLLKEYNQDQETLARLESAEAERNNTKWWVGSIIFVIVTLVILGR